MSYHYVILRADLPRGVMVAQCIHAAGESGPAGPGTYAVALAVPDSEALAELSQRLHQAGIKHHSVIESDEPYSGQLLAIGIPPQPRERLRRVLSSIPLMR